jgi:protein-disulfide isomerase
MAHAPRPRYHLALMKLVSSLTPAIRFLRRLALLLAAVNLAFALTPRSAHPDDSQLLAYLQKRFRIPNAAQIKLGPPSPTEIPGVTGRVLAVTNDRGTAVTNLFTDASGQQIIVGQYFDVRLDPWSRVPMTSVRLDDRPTLGPPEAAVTMVEFADFECPFCAHTFPMLETIVNSSYNGKVRLIFKHFPLNGHQWAKDAAAASECIRLQNPAAFWTFANETYAAQSSIDPKNLPERIKQFGEAKKLDLRLLNGCIESKSGMGHVDQDQADGQALHVASTPTIFVNGIPVVGPDEKSLRFVLDAELEHAKSASAK